LEQLTINNILLSLDKNNVNSLYPSFKKSLLLQMRDMKTQNIITWILILITIGQAIKILIHNAYGEIHFDIIPNLIEFKLKRE
jgi:hypothetical protein